MLRWFFVWRAQKRMGRTQYRLDRRRYRGVFRPGFFAHLSETNFWQSDNDPYLKTKRLQRRIICSVVLVVILVMLWVAFESLKGLQLF